MTLPTPYYDRDGITIYCGDALDILPYIETPVHAVVTDPPYASGARTEAKKSASGAMLRGQRWADAPIENDQMTTAGFVWLVRHVAADMRRLLVDGGALLSFIDWRQWPNLIGALESVNYRINGMIVWDKVLYGLGNGYRLQHELIAYASNGTPRVFDRGTPNVIQCRRDANDDHPSPKPVELLQKLLPVVAGRGDVLCRRCGGIGIVGGYTPEGHHWHGPCPECGLMDEVGS